MRLLVVGEGVVKVVVAKWVLPEDGIVMQWCEINRRTCSRVSYSVRSISTNDYREVRTALPSPDKASPKELTTLLMGETSNSDRIVL